MDDFRDHAMMSYGDDWLDPINPPSDPPIPAPVIRGAGASLASHPVWMEPASGPPDGHGLGPFLPPSMGEWGCKCGCSLLVIDLLAGRIRCPDAMHDGDGTLLLTFAAAAALDDPPPLIVYPSQLFS